MAVTPFDEPFTRFSRWFDEAKQSGGLTYPDAFCLSTATAEGAPSSRIVLLKGVDTQGFVFYTNKESHKSREIIANPQVALNFFWEKLGKQVRVEGRAEETRAAESDAYFATRPRDSQIGAWASQQSRPMASREAFEERIAAFTGKFAGENVPRPPHWGGWRVVPQRIEFWEEMPYRLHKREVFTRSGAGWQHEILYP